MEEFTSFPYYYYWPPLPLLGNGSLWGNFQWETMLAGSCLKEENGLSQNPFSPGSLFILEDLAQLSALRGGCRVFSRVGSGVRQISVQVPASSLTVLTFGLFLTFTELQIGVTNLLNS